MRSLAFFISAFCVSVMFGCAAPTPDKLDALQADIVADYPAVSQISPEALLALNSSDVLLLDIREPKEYAVSRLPGAIWVNPKADAQSALIQIGDVSDKQIIVYCSVGVRSSRFAERTQEDLLDMGAVSVSNLEKGIFGWHNDHRDLVDAKGSTEAVHHYDAIWKRYVNRKDQTRLTPSE